MRPILRTLVATTAIMSALATASETATATALTAAVQRLLADISGKWSVVGAAPEGIYEATVTLKQEAELLTGTINSPTFGAGKLTGTVKGDTIRFTFTIGVRGKPLELRAGGVIKDKDNISGQLEVPNGTGTFPFNARRVP